MNRYEIGNSPQSSLRSSNLGTLPNISENYQHEFDIQTVSALQLDESHQREFFSRSNSPGPNLSPVRRDSSPMRQSLKPNNSLHSQTPNVVPHTTVKDWQPKSVTYVGSASVTSHTGQPVGTANYVQLAGSPTLNQYDKSDPSVLRDLSPLKLSPTTNVCGIERNQSHEAGQNELPLTVDRDGKWNYFEHQIQELPVTTTFIPILRAGPVHIVRGHTQSLPSTGMGSRQQYSTCDPTLTTYSNSEILVWSSGAFSLQTGSAGRKGASRVSSSLAARDTRLCEASRRYAISRSVCVPTDP